MIPKASRHCLPTHIISSEASERGMYSTLVFPRRPQPSTTRRSLVPRRRGDSRLTCCYMYIMGGAQRDFPFACSIELYWTAGREQPSRGCNSPRLPRSRQHILGPWLPSVAPGSPRNPTVTWSDELLRTGGKMNLKAS
jgi:hypothetical protein